MNLSPCSVFVLKREEQSSVRIQNAGQQSLRDFLDTVVDAEVFGGLITGGDDVVGHSVGKERRNFQCFVSSFLNG